MKFFVLASNSFTGSHFIDYLLTHTDAEVVGVSRSPEYNPVLLPYRYNKKQSSRFTFHQLNLNTQQDQVLKLIDTGRPDYVVNFSAQGEVRNSWNHPEQWFQTNCMAVVQLAAELVKRDFIKRYVASSTPEVYGTTAEQMVESHLYAPSTPYGASKLSGDLFLMTLFKRYGFPVCLTRAANLYGIHQQLYRIIPRAAIYSLLGKTIELHGAGKSLRTFIHARDVADATYKVCLSGNNGEVYHLAPQDKAISIAEIVQMVCNEMNVSFENTVHLVNENFGQDGLYSLSSAKIRKELNWSEQVSLQDGIRETVNWIKAEWSTIKDLPHEYQHQL